MPKYDNLVHNMRLLRIERNITGSQLCHELNLSNGRIGDIENSNARKIAIKDEEIAEIARFFGVTVDALLNKKAYVEFK